MNKQAHAIFEGKVQGVGFRYTAREIADELGVTGWVRNLPDGTVELVAEGDEVLLRQMIGRLSEGFSRSMRDVQVQWGLATEGARSFEIRR